MKELNLDLKRLKAERVAKGLDQEQFAKKIGMSNGSSISAYLNNLIDLEIIERKQPIFENSPKKAIYAFKDNMFKFWFKFIAEAQDQIALERTKGILIGHYG
ncbi:helix-turn-helix transcriptional regulator [Lactobacillus helveticus]|uniref:HTH cro/C1-type domain-containing protein n=1 Tax=Lactobacillus helveticus CIRM-BIA 951 TaxID=1226334 RepID=U6F7P8_LACHE|nr:helix-turn-helix transcriptional regulator [Lactobacillus helveticus]MDY0991492.1 helix-turn-helix transcriptional regulator [Lactobacillus helveticus]MDY1002172.1 helix-turn-helix transcriptional regulator [Lactobacillus helveticus]MEB2873999.1 helix-turn-helix transcriptional regulator [Lactobacillus helveticus]CDI59049.1 Protein of unknown function [Lactobacillus helveticus CIRM-BIA 951]